MCANVAIYLVAKGADSVLTPWSTEHRDWLNVSMLSRAKLIVKEIQEAASHF